MKQTGRSPSKIMDQQSNHADICEAAVDVAHLCVQWLDQEEQFQQKLSRLLLKLSHASPFGDRSQAVSSSQLLELTSLRAELHQQQSLCRLTLGRLLNCNGDEVRLSSLEGLLPAEEQRQYRERRLQVAVLLQQNQQLLRSVEVKLSCCNVSVTNLLNDLLGQPDALAGYGADGHQTAPASNRTLHAIS